MSNSQHPNGTRRYCEDIFKRHFENKMINPSYHRFTFDFKTLHGCIIDAMEEAVKGCESAWEKMLEQQKKELTKPDP